MAECPNCGETVNRLVFEKSLTKAPTSGAHLCPHCDAILGTVAAEP